jgi:hypothetical protein
MSLRVDAVGVPPDLTVAIDSGEVNLFPPAVVPNVGVDLMVGVGAVVGELTLKMRAVPVDDVVVGIDVDILAFPLASVAG